MMLAELVGELPNKSIEIVLSYAIDDEWDAMDLCELGCPKTAIWAFNNFESEELWRDCEYDPDVVDKVVDSSPMEFVRIILDGFEIADLSYRNDIARYLLVAYRGGRTGRFEAVAEIMGVEPQELADINKVEAPQELLETAIDWACAQGHDRVLSWIVNTFELGEHDNSMLIESFDLVCSKGFQRTAAVILAHVGHINLFGAACLAFKEACIYGHMATVKWLESIFYWCDVREEAVRDCVAIGNRRVRNWVYRTNEWRSY